MEGRKVVGLAARDSTGFLSPYSFNLRKTGSEDVVVKVLYCGIDHTDLHQMRNEIHSTNYPLVPGHEVVGEVVELGINAKKFKIGAKVGVGCMIWACKKCPSCLSNREQYCPKRLFTVNGTYEDGSPTYGGLSSHMVVDENFVVGIPETLAPEQAAPLLCAGVTAYSPLKQLIGAPARGGVLGLGGVGHLGVIIAKAMGHHVTVISSSDAKKREALEHLGADAFLVGSDATAMGEAASSLDYIIDTVPATHSLKPYLSLLKVGGQLIIVGAVPEPLQFVASDLILGNLSISGSFIGSVEDTRELLSFWAKKRLTTMVELVKADSVNEAFRRMERNDVRYRFVLDLTESELRC